MLNKPTDIVDGCGARWRVIDGRVRVKDLVGRWCDPIAEGWTINEERREIINKLLGIN